MSESEQPRPRPFRVGADARSTRSARHTRRRTRLRQAAVTAASFTLVLGLFAGALLRWACAKYDGQIHRVWVLPTNGTSISDPGR